MKCIFCLDISLFKDTPSSVAYICSKCNTTYWFYGNGILKEFNVHIKMNNKVYNAHNLYDETGKFHYFSLWFGMDNIKINYNPHITPYNAIEKLKKILLFS